LRANAQAEVTATVAAAAQKLQNMLTHAQLDLTLAMDPRLRFVPGQAKPGYQRFCVSHPLS